MLFNTLDFALFFFCVFLLYFLLPHRGQNVMLLAASYFFYGCWDWRFLSLILISTLVDYFCGLGLSLSKKTGLRRLLLLGSLVTNLGLLGFFKYFNFFAGSLQDLAGGLGIALDFTTLNIILPVGISFYTFQTLSYTIDIYRGELAPTRRIVDFALFVAFFPQLVAGPIERAKRLLPQILNKRRITRDNLYEGAWLIFWGLFKKVVIADRMAPVVDNIFAQPEGRSGGLVLVGCYAFALQIYGDFSGYSDMARGLARTLGFNLCLNFNLPYFATNPSDFWRRWHISLSTWLRDYLYIPLGGGRGGKGSTYRNLMTTMVLGGLWHGAAWNFVLWGFYHGLILILHRLAAPLLGTLSPGSALGRGLWFAVRMAVMFHLTCLGWLLFRAESIQHIGVMLKSLFLHFSLDADTLTTFKVVFGIAFPIILVQLGQFFKKDALIIFRVPFWLRGAFYFFLYYCIAVYGVTGGKQFIYFQF